MESGEGFRYYCGNGMAVLSFFMDGMAVVSAFFLALFYDGGGICKEEGIRFSDTV